MNKKILLFGILSILAVSLVVAVVVWTHNVRIDANVSEAFSSDTFNLDFSGIVGDSVTKNISINNLASVPIPVHLSWTEKSNSFTLDNSAGTCLPYPSPTCEMRVIINASDVGVTTLESLETIEWDANVLEGYLPHVDVYLDNGEVLVFEYAKASSPYDNTPYPLGELNTFGDKGIVDNDAKAWLSSGPAGPVGDPVFDGNHKTLSEWKVFYPTANVVKFELEVDNWISASNSEVKNVKVNDVSVQGVVYTTTFPETFEVQPGANIIPVVFQYDTGSPVGKVSGTMTLTRGTA